MRFEIPVKPYVKKYLLNHFKGKSLRLDRDFISKLGNVLIYDQKDAIMHHLLVLLKENETRSDYNDWLKYYTDKIEVILPDSEVFMRGARHATSYAIISFNLFLEKLIKAEIEDEAKRIHGINSTLDMIFKARVPGHSRATIYRDGITKISRKSAIEGLMQKYEWDENDIPYETLKKIFYRKEIAAGIKTKPEKKSKINISVCPVSSHFKNNVDSDPMNT